MKLPNNRFNIITPVLSRNVNLNLFDTSYPEVCDYFVKNESRLFKSSEGLFQKPIDIFPVSPRSPIKVREATELIACYFRREKEYDFIQYSAREKPDSKDRIFIFTRPTIEEKNLVLGAIVFRWITYNNFLPSQWSLNWVWLHPFLRNKGILTDFWPFFVELYGDFNIESPISKSLWHLLKKVNHFKNNKELTHD
jgi:hypothetical protein